MGAIADLVALAPAAGLSAKLSPQLATTVSSAGEWSYEIKFDGYRSLARVDGDHVQLFTRNGHDWTAKMVSLAAAVAELGLTSAWLDCEAVVNGPDGLPSFNALQNAFDLRGSESIELYVFDLPFAEGRDLRALPFRDRRAALEAVFDGRDWPRVHLSGLFDADGASGWRPPAQWVSRASWPSAWTRRTSGAHRDLVEAQVPAAAGVRDWRLHRTIGVDDRGRQPGTGRLRRCRPPPLRRERRYWLGRETCVAIMAKLKKLEVDVSPFDAAHPPKNGRWSRRSAASERWVKPKLVAEVSFAEWTPDGSVRHASFQGFRTDKKARAVRREGIDPLSTEDREV